jgi:hypothetical protein
MKLRLDQLKKIKLSLDPCGPEVSLYDAFTSFLSINPTLVNTSSPIGGSGSVSSPITILPLGASPGQVLAWSGSEWVPILLPPTDGPQTLSINGNILSISEGNSVQLPATTLTAGTGISIVNNQINNTAPDIPVNISAGNNINVTGAYPNYTISASGSAATLIPVKVTLEYGALNVNSFSIMLHANTDVNVPIDIYLNGVLKTITEDYTQTINNLVLSVIWVHDFSPNDRITIKYYRY